MSASVQNLVNHLQTEFIDGTADAHADFLADVESWARVHGLVMGNGQVRERFCLWKWYSPVRHPFHLSIVLCWFFWTLSSC